MKGDNTAGLSEQEPVKTTKKSLEILEHIRQLEGATLSELLEEVEMAKSTLYRHLTTLETEEYLIREGNVYHIGLKFLGFGEHARNRRELYQAAEPKVRELAEETGERAQFVVEEHGKAIFFLRETGDHAVRVDSGIGMTLPLHSSAAGKVILAHLPEARREQLLSEHPLPARTSETITDPELLREELQQIRDQGYGFNREESVEGLNAVGVPVFDGEQRIIGAFSITGPSHRLKGERLEVEVLDLLLGTANELELNLTYS